MTQYALNLTMKAVAEDAGVSRATVSRVFSRPELVSEYTSRRVLASAVKLGYVPNRAAMSLASRSSSDMVGLLLREATNPAYAALHDHLLRKSYDEGLFVISMSAGDYYSDGGEALRMSRLMTLRPSGVFVASGLIHPEEVAPFASQVPTIVLGRLLPVADLNNIAYDQLGHARMLSEAVFDRGHRQIIVCVTEPGTSRTEHLRSTALAEHFRELGGSVEEIRNQDIMEDPDALFAAIDDLRRSHHCTSVAFANDQRALRFMVTAKRRGLRVPEDIGVSGCDGTGLGTDVTGLLSVRIPIEKVCTSAAAHMRRLVIDHETLTEPIREVFTGTLVGGDTV